ncbi:hypothetical protein BKA00_006272 [Actinomadura coerulea]|uniref:Uncharacterized protein n=1 Tax=Actinomadura coerulea TaxID=46159 RepID=A0A7X0G4P4_9ACTN|nr:hypothetical protein [Actinomadura coerulea]MBB6399358.1 hypothetical protein [Actinomadura coerulea]GGQ28355.1 hypothetical protein GCM10010187_51310 [Actinomadura coerulea]
MNVLFLALGASRKGAVSAEAERVIAGGGTATVLIGKPSAWRKHPLPEGAEVVELAEVERGYRPGWVRFWLYRAPRLVLRICLPGPLRRWRDRLDNAYRRRVAKPLNRRLARRYRRDPVQVRRRAVERDVISGRSVGLVVVGDAQSLVTASELADVLTGTGAPLAYTIDHHLPTAGHARG